jgi:hypothetical protein
MPTPAAIVRADKATKVCQRDSIPVLAPHETGFVFQEYNLVPVLSALENVECVRLLQGVDEKRRRDEALRLLHALRADGMAHRRPNGRGQQQRVAVARAIATRPVIVLPGEPTANLDSQSGHDLRVPDARSDGCRAGAPRDPRLCRVNENANGVTRQQLPNGMCPNPLTQAVCDQGCRPGGVPAFVSDWASNRSIRRRSFGADLRVNVDLKNDEHSCRLTLAHGVLERCHLRRAALAPVVPSDRQIRTGGICNEIRRRLPSRRAHGRRGISFPCVAGSHRL